MGDAPGPAQMDDQPENDPYEGDEYDFAPSDAESFASVISIGRDEDVAAVCGRIDSAATFAVVLHARRGNRALSRELGMRRLVRHAEDTGRTVAIATRSSALAARARQSGIPVAAAPERIRWDAGNRVVVGVGRRALVLPAIGTYLQIGVLLAAIIFLAGALLFAGPSADIAVYPVTTGAQERLTFSASLDQAEPDFDRMRFPGVEVSTSRTVTLAVPTTGTVDAPVQPAVVTLVISNSTSEEVSVAAGEIVYGPARFAFIIGEAVTIPAGAQAQVTATADEPGTVGNVAAATVVEWENPELNVLTLTNPEAAAGGTVETVRAVTEADVAGLRQLARTLADSEDMRSALTAQRPDAAIFLRSIELAVAEGEPFPVVGGAGDIVLMDATLHLTAVVIEASTLDEVASTLLSTDDRGAFVSGSLVAVDTGDGQTEEDGVYTASFLVAAEFSRSLTEAEVRDAVSGKSPESAESALLARADVQDADVDVTPGWVPWLPRFDFRIDVEFRSLEDGEPAGETPADDDDTGTDATPTEGATPTQEAADDEAATRGISPPVAVARARSRRPPYRRRDQ